MARMFCREKEEREREGARRKNRRKLKLLAIRGVISAGIVYCTVYGILYHYVGKLPKDGGLGDDGGRGRKGASFPS